MGNDGIAMFLVSYSQKLRFGKEYLDLLGIEMKTNEWFWNLKYLLWYLNLD